VAGTLEVGRLPEREPAHGGPDVRNSGEGRVDVGAALPEVCPAVGGAWRTGDQEDKDKSERIPTAIIVVRSVTGHDRNVALIFG
jgi:hypothetical protein